jgi:hypothetical protein
MNNNYALLHVDKHNVLSRILKLRTINIDNLSIIYFNLMTAHKNMYNKVVFFLI